MQLTQRQATILKAVVEEHHASGRPVGSRTLVDLGVVDASPSTVRYELGRLDELGLLESPHTSAGRVPTDAGYRMYVDHLLDGETDAGASRSVIRAPFEAVDAGARIDEALRMTTQQLADATELLAVITAPRANGAAIRHVEVLQLQPMLLVVVIITAAGDVERHVVPTQLPVDPGLVDWVGEYLSEQVVGLSAGHRLVRQRLLRTDLDAAERAMLGLVAPAFFQLGSDDVSDVHVGGSAGMLTRLGSDVQRVVNLVAMLDERRRLLGALRPIADTGLGWTSSGGGDRAVRVLIGVENEIPELQNLSVVGTPYGSGSRALGMVGVIGPRAMDYTCAMHAVNAAADQLAAVADELYGV